MQLSMCKQNTNARFSSLKATNKVALCVTNYHIMKNVSFNTRKYGTPIYQEFTFTNLTYNDYNGFHNNLNTYISYCKEIYPEYYITLITQDIDMVHICILHEPCYSLYNTNTMNHMY